MATASALLLPLPLAAQAKTLKWSGYTWTLRTGTGGPGANNIWSAQNAAVSNGNLLLNIVPRGAVWTSVELTTGQTFSFGRYRWVINSDLSKASAASVLGLFTYSPQMAPGYGEQDFEFTQAWSAPPALPSAWAVSWRSPTSRASSNFNVPSAPPYTATITWMPGSISFLLTDGAGRVVFWRAVKTRLAPKGLRVHINYWVTDHGAITGPGASPQMSIRSFHYTPATTTHSPNARRQSMR
jgi:hypothetical protein